MKNSTLLLISLALLSFTLIGHANKANSDSKYSYKVPKSHGPISVDGLAMEPGWQKSEWRSIDKLILGPPVKPEDFNGRYKLLWDEKYLYLLVEMHDDILSDKYADPLYRYWEDDALEVFIDEDASGGIHQFNYNAFAYHIALDNQAVDIGPFLTKADEKAGKANVRTYPEHITSQWRRSLEKPHKILWEVAISIYSDKYKDQYAEGENAVSPEELYKGKNIGFMLAYCDSDTSDTRENFIGDIDIEPLNGDKNRGYIDASVFGKIILVD